MTSTARQLDQFYTHATVAQACVQRLLSYFEQQGIQPGWWIEPSVGTGSLWQCLPKHPIRIAIDLSPGPGAPQETVQHDFLTWNPDAKLNLKQGALIGNPPFGKNASLAVQFFNHAASLSIDYMGWIVPRTFSKPLFQNRLNRHFDLTEEHVIADHSFIFEGQTYNVPTVFQIWKRRKDGLRAIHKDEKTHPHLIFVNKKQALKSPNAISFQRVGARAGLITKDFKNKAEASHYFIDIQDSQALARLMSIDWNSVKYCTAGNPSIGKGELIKLYSESCATSSSSAV